jgi:hypothetical protein
MFNLLGNAVKLTARGRVTARLSVEALGPKSEGEDRRRVRLEVEDTGVGISVAIVGLAAHVMVHPRAEYLAAAMNGVVGKPISPAVLLSEIGRIIAEMSEPDADDAERQGVAETG